MKSGYKKIFWGILLATLHITINNIQILPVFVGYIIVAIGLKQVNESGKYSSSLSNASKWNMALIVVNFLSLFVTVNITGGGYNSGVLLIWTSAITVIEIMMYYKLLDGTADVLESISNTEMAEQYRKNKNTYLKLEAMVYIVMFISIISTSGLLMTLVVLIGLGIRIWILILMNRVSKLLN